MSWFPLNKNTIALILVATITIGFFVAGLFDVLDYFIVKVLLILGSVILFGIAFFFGLKNRKKNHPAN
jgi:hypothetical protein